MTDALSRIETLFHAALSLPPEARAAWLRTTEQDPTIRDTVDALLANDDATDNPLRPALLAALSADDAGPQRIGRYRLIGELGQGGMAGVWLAERDIDGRAQRVALKRLHGASTAALRRRGARERALLAALNHRGIAGLIDGGETDDGTPYFVMEYVEGEPLLRYLAERRPSQRERLQLFRQICLAVEHAHQRLILHLDLKPSNVLVRADGSTALIDFGIGRALDDSEAGEHRGERTAAFTPIYAAPELRDGRAPTTATDVYMAGLLLVEMLSDGALSRRARDAATGDPFADPAIRRALHGDLSRLVARATAHDPDDRYASIAALRMDVEQFLEGRMLAASRQAWWVRGGKFCRRNRWPLLGAGAAALLALAFVLQLSVERTRALAAEKNALLAQDLQSSLLVALSPGGNPQAQARIEALLQRERERLRDSGDPRALDPAWRTIASIVAVAEIYVAIGDPEPALKSADEALRLLAEPRAAQRLRDGRDDDLLARAHGARGQALNALERYADAEPAFARMRALREQQRREGRRLEDRQALATALLLQGKAAIEWRDFAQAERALAEAQALAVTASPQRSFPVELAIARLDAASESGEASAQGAQRSEALLALAETGLEAASPLWIETWLALSRWRQIEGKPQAALADAQRARDRAQQLFGERSVVTATIDNNLGTMLADLGRYRDALTHFDRARATQARLSPDKVAVLASIDINRCRAQYHLGDYAQAASSAQAALDALPDTHSAYRRLRSIAWSNLARARSELGQHPAALRAARRMLSDPWLQAATPLENAFGRISMFVVLLNADALDEAQAILDQTTPVLEAQLPAGHPAFIYMARRRGLLAAARGRFDEADRAFGLALTRMDATDDDPLTRAEIQAARAHAAARLGDPARARQLLTQALPVLRAETSADARPRIEAEALLRSLSSGAKEAPSSRR
jgi:serine/threonine-protein kinase